MLTCTQIGSSNLPLCYDSSNLPLCYDSINPSSVLWQHQPFLCAMVDSINLSSVIWSTASTILCDMIDSSSPSSVLWLTVLIFHLCYDWQYQSFLCDMIDSINPSSMLWCAGNCHVSWRDSSVILASYRID